MRRGTIAIRIPKVEIVTSSSTPSVCIKGTSETFISMSPKERIRLSREYNRNSTPVPAVVYPLSAITPSLSRSTALQNATKVEFKSFDLPTPLHSNKTPANTYQNRLRSVPRCRKPSPESKFDQYVKLQDLHNCLLSENELFPKDYNENLKFLPDINYFRSESPSRFLVKTSKKLKKPPKKSSYFFTNLSYLTRSKTPTNKLQPSFLTDSKMRDLFGNLQKRSKSPGKK